jgi:LPXTG-motif cell wall-anchored protein
LAQANPQDAAVKKALGYMRTQQGADGTFAGFGAGSTADAIYALTAAGVKAADFRSGQASAVDGLAKLAPEAAKDAGVAAKFVLAALQAGQNPRVLGGTDELAAVEKSYNTATGRYGKDVTAHALALLALHAAGTPVRQEATTALEKLQLSDGGWSFDGTTASGSDTNTTSLAYQALVSTGGTNQARQKAMAYFHAQQNADGGFPYSQTSKFGNASDANSTALSVQAILASGQSPNDWAKNGKTPLDRLLAFQNPSGAFRFQDAQPADNQLATYQAIPAVMGKSYPLKVMTAAQPAVSTQNVAPGATATSPTGGTAPTRLPSTGQQPAPLLAVLVFGLVVMAAGLLVRQRRV